MGKATQRRPWAVTIPFDAIITKPTTVTVNGFEWEYFIGDQEMDFDDSNVHHHVGIRCKSRSVTKSAARSALSKILNCPEEDLKETYFKPVIGGWKQYVDYSFKSTMTGVDEDIRRIAQKVRAKTSVIDKNNMKNALIKAFGSEKYSRKYKQPLNEYLTSDACADSRSIFEVPFDSDLNLERYDAFFEIFLEQLRNCTFETEWPDPVTRLFNGSPHEDKVVFIALMTLLPWVIRRSPNFQDGLPALYFYGSSHTGKSTMFEGPIFRRFAVDAQGVSKFQLQGDQSAILFDEMRSDFLEKSDAALTVKQMAVSGSTTIKTFGSTDNVSAYIYVTSQYQPSILDDYTPPFGKDGSEPELQDAIRDHDQLRISFKRRFIFVNFRRVLKHDPGFILWSDPNLINHIALKAYSFLDKLVNSRLYTMSLKMYHDHIRKNYIDE